MAYLQCQQHSFTAQGMQDVQGVTHSNVHNDLYPCWEMLWKGDDSTEHTSCQAKGCFG
jgi:hypothetical protein